MDRDEMNRRLKAVGVSQAQLCRVHGISKSAPTNWAAAVPEYVRPFIVAMEMLDEPGRLDLIHKTCVERLREEQLQN